MKEIRKITYLLVVTAVAGLIFYALRVATADPSIEIKVNSSEHTVVMPYEKSFRFVATIKNNGNNIEDISVRVSEGEVPKDWHLLAPVGQYELAPGQEIDYVAVFEPGETRPGPRPEAGPKEETVSVPVEFSWDGGNQEFDVTVKTKRLPWKDREDNLSEVAVSVFDKDTNQRISDATVVVTLPSGMEQNTAEQEGKDYQIEVPSGKHLEKLVREYKIDQTSTGYFLQVSAQGYKSYFKANWLPKKGSSEETITLEPLKKVGEYNLKKTMKSGYSIWWIRASRDNRLFAFSQGAHENPGAQPPSQSKVLLTDDSGNLFWERKTGGECWGLDISPDGKYIAAGCHDGKIYVWDKDGNQAWQYVGIKDNRVRWVRFSPDGNFLLAGPVDNQPEKSGLFGVKPGNLLWSFFTGDYLREGRFSSDSKTAYLASANGALHALETSSGSLKWLGIGDYYIPFMLGIADNLDLAVAAGKGRAFTALDLNTGQRKWQVVVDQTITAGQMARDGSVVASTVGGMAYGLSTEGKFIWVRQYGGVGHNGVCYAKSSKYSLFGGPNPTLFDHDGNILWQREPDKEIEMTGPQERDEGANAVWLSDDASLVIVGQGDGGIQFWKGKVKPGNNSYSQLTGSHRDEGAKLGDRDATGLSWLGSPIWLMLAGGAALIILTAVAVGYFVKVRNK